MLHDNYEGGLRMYDYICTIVLCEKAINYISCHDPIQPQKLEISNRTSYHAPR